MMDGGYGLLKNVRLLCASARKVENCDILFFGRSKKESSRICRIGQELALPSDQPVKLYTGASRLYCRAFVDTACYLPSRPGRYGESFVAVARAAQAGGFATVALLPGAGNPLDTPLAVAGVIRESSTQDVQFLPVASIVTSDRTKSKLTDFSEMKKAGAVALTVPDGRRLPQELLLEAMYRAAELDMTLYCPVSGNAFSQKGAVNAGRIAKLLKVPGIVRCGELLSINESLLLAQESGCRIHIPVISLAESVQAIRMAKDRGVRVTCGTAAQYFSLTEDDLIFRGVNAKLDPPLRTAEDRAAIVKGLRDGTIDCIAGDHRPCTKEEKGTEIKSGAFGAVGLETAFAAGLTFLVLPGKLDLFSLIEKMTEAPAAVLGVSPTLQSGSRMDLVLLDEEKEMIYTNNTLHGRAVNTPYYGTALRGCVGQRFIDGRM
ncbi:MAG: hypothetical protein E7599_03680 [Ruminococcaceae bacterium]|nr:hypothetical protein [Oscillospiraceae bacterium]